MGARRDTVGGWRAGARGAVRSAGAGARGAGGAGEGGVGGGGGEGCGGCAGLEEGLERVPEGERGFLSEVLEEGCREGWERAGLGGR